MITKILFTLGLIVVVLAVVRFRQQRGAAPPRIDRPDAVEAAPFLRRTHVGWLATAAVVLMLFASGLFLFLTWRDANEIIRVQVIDAGSGRSATYQAFRGEIEDRSFRTTDGRRIVLAETERMETAAFMPGQN